MNATTRALGMPQQGDMPAARAVVVCGERRGYEMVI
jgi:hypothetical protein